MSSGWKHYHTAPSSNPQATGWRKRQLWKQETAESHFLDDTEGLQTKNQENKTKTIWSTDPVQADRTMSVVHVKYICFKNQHDSSFPQVHINVLMRSIHQGTKNNNNNNKKTNTYQVRPTWCASGCTSRHRRSVIRSHVVKTSGPVSAAFSWRWFSWGPVSNDVQSCLPPWSLIQKQKKKKFFK